MNWNDLADTALVGESISRWQALEVLRSPDSEVVSLLAAAYRVRHHYFGKRVRIHVLKNAKKGLCPEDCHFCSQSSISSSDIQPYRLLSRNQIIEGGRRAAEAHAWKFCIVTATRGPSLKELDTICDAVYQIKRHLPIKVCCSLGLLTKDKAHMLRDAGVDRFNHNLETSKRFFPSICSTHTYQDRVETLRLVKEAGMDTCCGGIVGMGENDEDIVDLAFAVRELNIDSIPVNFLDPRDGTPLAGYHHLTPNRCLKTLALFRFLNPSKDIRAAGGREVNLRSLQSMALYPANSLFAEGYLTTPGQSFADLRRMIEDAGFEIEHHQKEVSQ